MVLSELSADDTKEIILCPTCLVEVQEDRKCPLCGSILDKGDWPLIPKADDLAPWSVCNLLPPECGGKQYRLMPVSPMKLEGALRTSFPYEFATGKRAIRIGGSTLKADVLIDGAAPLHAVLMLNGRSRSWWVYDCGSDSGTFVNDERVHCKELHVDDIISIANVKLAFRGNRLETGRVSAEGMSLSVENLCFAIECGDGTNRKILDNVTFSISAGEFIGILGPSGCGKSSLVQRLIGLADPDSGEIYANGNKINSNIKGFRAATAYLPQNVDETLHDALTLTEEIDCFRRIHLIESGNECQENKDCLGTLGLSGKENYRIGNLGCSSKSGTGLMDVSNISLLDAA